MVTPITFHGDLKYAVTLESQNQEGFLQVIQRLPIAPETGRLKRPDGQLPPPTYDKDPAV